MPEKKETKIENEQIIDNEFTKIFSRFNDAIELLNAEGDIKKLLERIIYLFYPTTSIEVLLPTALESYRDSLATLILQSESQNRIQYSEIFKKNFFGSDYDIKSIKLKESDEVYITYITSIISQVFMGVYSNKYFNVEKYNKDLISLKSIIKILLTFQPNHFKISDSSTRLDLAEFLFDIIDEDKKEIVNVINLLIFDYEEEQLPIELKNPFVGRHIGTPIRKASKKKQQQKLEPKEINDQPEIPKQETNIQLRQPYELFPNIVTTPSITTSSDESQEPLESPDFIVEEQIEDMEMESKEDKFEKNNTDLDKNSDNKTKNKQKISGRKNVTSYADMNSIPVIIVIDFLKILLEKNSLTFSYAYLCLMTGINWHRIENIKIKQDCNANDINDKNEIFLNIDNGTLHYRVYKGATQFKGIDGIENAFADVMSLCLPNKIVSIISDNRTESPFLGLGQKIQEYAKYYRTKYGGISPTPERLNASFIHNVARNGLINIEKCIIAGYFSFAYKASSKYAKFDVDLLNNHYQKCILNFKSKTENLLHGEDLSDIILINHSSKEFNTSIGSLLAQPLDSFKELIKQHRLKFNQVSSLKGVKHNVEAIKFQQMYLYLMYQLLLGMRPFGEKTSLYPSEGDLGWIIIQKDSNMYKEKALVNVPDVISNQLIFCKNNIRYIEKRLVKKNYEVAECSFLKDHIPVIPNINTHKRTLTYRKMTGSEYEELLEDIRLMKYMPGNHYEGNIYRHSLYSDLLSNTSEPLLSEMFQHHRIGLEIFSKYSVVNIKEYFDLKLVLEQIAKDLNFQVLE